MHKRNCECCRGSYATGKSYGDYWCMFPVFRDTTFKERIKSLFTKFRWIRCTPITPKGLCEFCNPSSEKWFVKDMKCHA